MSEERDTLERDLAALSTWRGSEPQVWRRAAAQWKTGPKAPPWWRRSENRHYLWIGLAAAVLVVAASVWTVMGPSAARSRASLPVSPASATLPDFGRRALKDSLPSVRQPEPVFVDGATNGFLTGGYDGDPTPPLGAPVRQVVQKATIELASSDVRAAFLKAQMIVSQVAGEYVESSTLTGAAEQARAELTLRVSAERLPQVLNDLRDLGDVRSENSAGEDVTDQMIDLEARLRNEERVEHELLELLEKRGDAALKDVLDLRQHLAGVRRSIETLRAQRENLAHMVSLARVLVIIRHVEPPEEPEQGGIGDHFVRSLGAAWAAGLRTLAASLAAVLKALVGGLLWWAAVLLVVGAALRHHRRVRLGLA